jgi:uncharacterized protein YqeY
VPLTEEELSTALTSAMKAREMERVYVLRGVLTAVKNLKVEKRVPALAEADLVQIVRREIRQREEAESFASQGGRTEAVEQNRRERALLEALVPPQLGPAELEQAIRGIVARPDARSLGAVMSALKADLAGRYDGKQASEIARRVLAETSGS